jgi:hypothetical protein
LRRRRRRTGREHFGKRRGLLQRLREGELLGVEVEGEVCLYASYDTNPY